MDWVRGETVGHGSFGTVNLVIPRSHKGEFPPLMAVKSTSVSNSDSLRNEKEVLGELANCPHVIRCLGDDYSSENGSRLYNLFLEYASGGCLADRIKKFGGGRLPESDVRRYTGSILKGLHYIHGNGFVHCDIKLQNILLCSDGGNDVVKIADFGLAKKAQSKEAGFGFRGTPLYMSPESVTGSEYESQSDIWALGCVVVEMVTGKPAWKCRPESDVSSLLFRIGLGEELPEIPVELSEEGKDFLGKCFVKDPRKRWTAQMLLEHPFVLDFDDDADTVPLKMEYDEVSTSPRCPFDFPEWPILLSPKSSPESDTWVDREFNFCSGSSSLSCHSSPADRIKQLVTDDRPDWSVSDSWVTVR